MTTDGGGWTVIHKRLNGTGGYNRKWAECENGFGDIRKEFWFGNKFTHILTSSGKYELRVDIIDKKNKKWYAVYKTFVVGDAKSKYKLTVGDYSGNAGDKLTYHNGMKFTTVDQDNDPYSSSNCAQLQNGSWWYKKCSNCDLSRGHGNRYKPYRGHVQDLVESVMMIRKA
ncbi:fibrinogen-like protein A [Mytilus californianus]|uniref:fibrinogen-like protein A n=1 Tax=Mytilus californianus TaxID=6549 RepID=UPI002245C5A0|nr:fibrinogen-like protein A [Mytilus californianus]XP_052085758.1 fibrinogen-like protein A [Mytilus californianus]XP_052085759.1 fibrinogen-like protein A [Mytilus californianus]XP_052085760.1 fibrinogen-like protein A [Mytilus californianus]XP_052085761.1 fibrinogen-like protein A [Mytilus californianus]